MEHVLKKGRPNWKETEIRDLPTQQHAGGKKEDKIALVDRVYDIILGGRTSARNKREEIRRASAWKGGTGTQA